MYILKSKYCGLLEPATHEHELIQSENRGVVKFKIYILPMKTSIYEMTKDITLYVNLPMDKQQSFIYISSLYPLNNDIVVEIEDFIKKNIPNVQEDDNHFRTTFFGRMDSPKEAIDLLGNVTLHFPQHADRNKLFYYTNYVSLNDKNLISKGNSIVKYVNLEERHNFSATHGKVLNDGVFLFTMYPTECNIVYILPDTFSILDETNNKIAYFEHENFVFWIVTHHTFLNNKNRSNAINTTKFCPQHESIGNLNFIFNTFSQFGFSDPEITPSAVIAHDRNCGMLMFVGIYNIQQGNEYGKYFEMLGLK